VNIHAKFSPQAHGIYYDFSTSSLANLQDGCKRNARLVGIRSALEDQLMLMRHNVMVMKNILVVEDEPQIRKNLQEILTLHDFNAIAVTNGLQGLDALQVVRPDVILCDVNMPEMDGHDFLREVQSNQLTANIPFIFLTANSERPDVRSGMELGASDYLTKPVRADELLKAINIQINKQTIAEQCSNDRLNQLRSSICGALPHELYTPLNGIFGAADLLIQDHDALVMPERLELAHLIRDSVSRLHDLVRNFMLYVELELHMNAPDRPERIRQNQQSRVLVKPLLGNIAQQVASQHDRSTDLQLTIEPAALAISEAKLIKLLQEVIDNAFKFSCPGQLVQVLGRQLDQTYHIEILDRGRGMTAHQIAAIGAYMQFDRDRYEQQGSGLGLTIALRLAQMHDGRLSVRSTHGQETAVTIILPLMQELK
jgi:two-component system, sensor histidine kinase and response regulator